jgi:DNA-binding transcriptional MerR regulator
VDHTSPKKEIVTVAEMARMCGLSRSRFYMLAKDGIMPTPSRSPTTKRPFYSREQQEQCLLVRRTNCGLDGKAILFYANKWSREPVAPARRARSTATTRRTQARPQRTQVDPIIEELRGGLEQLGMANVPETKVRTALADEYPDGYANVAMPILLMTIFRRLSRQDSPDNVAR